jgi:hypothetical protein
MRMGRSKLDYHRRIRHPRIAYYNIVVNRIDSFGDINKAQGHWGWHYKMLLSVHKSCFSPLPKSFLCLIKPISMAEENIGCCNK